MRGEALALPGGPLGARHGVEVQGVADGQVSLEREGEDRQNRTV